MPGPKDEVVVTKTVVLTQTRPVALSSRSEYLVIDGAAVTLKKLSVTAGLVVVDAGTVFSADNVIVDDSLYQRFWLSDRYAGP